MNQDLRTPGPGVPVSYCPTWGQLIFERRGRRRSRLEGACAFLGVEVELEVAVAVDVGRAESWDAAQRVSCISRRSPAMSRDRSQESRSSARRQFLRPTLTPHLLFVSQRHAWSATPRRTLRKGGDFMKRTLAVSLALMLTALVGCGSGAGDPPVGETSQDLSSSRTAIAVDPLCIKGEKLCLVGGVGGTGPTCHLECVPDTYLCIAPGSCGHVVCDPVGKPPREGCDWSTTACKWECPVCDPPPPPEKTGCSWDEASCVWLCL
jgi:hypothetical protein